MTERSSDCAGGRMAGAVLERTKSTLGWVVRPKILFAEQAYLSPMVCRPEKAGYIPPQDGTHLAPEVPDILYVLSTSQVFPLTKMTTISVDYPTEQS